ncbi:sulfatase-like hydrolase/transferase [Aquimarina algiphila]|uniref:sulfatase-like hydrolase/transferase n=1 Tax=Aquimarina algiphila TaxID=2047982 RepID=UPI002493230B|nr:sulfatase-like hydrolase/transferase [Aquimarina algiphila]
MSNFNQKWLLLLCLIFLGPLFSVCAQNGKKNVLFVFVDDLNTMIGAYGDNQAKTPNLDKLARKSTIFMNAYATAPICGPSRTSILTGKYPTTTKVHENAPHFRDLPGNRNLVTLPQYFKSKGYVTVSGGKVFHKPRGAGAAPNPKSDPQSWDIQHKGVMGSQAPPRSDRFTRGLNLNQPGIGVFFKQQFDYFPVIKDFTGRDLPLERTNDFKSLDFVAKYIKDKPAGGKPFFAAAGTLRPHMPLYCPKKYFDMYRLEDIKLPKVGPNSGFNDLADVVVPDNWSALHTEVKNKGQWKNFVRAYLSNITYADACVGNLLDALENSRHKNNTIIVFMSDHGFHIGQKNFWTKPTFWEQVAKVPFMIYDPSNPVRKVVRKPVSLVDVYPTLVDLAGLPKKNDVDGINLKPLINQPNGSWDRIALTSRSQNAHTLRDKNFRFIQRKLGNGKTAEELYDHRTDPDEWFNLLDRNNRPTKPELQGTLTAFRNKLQRVLTGDYTALGRGRVASSRSLEVLEINNNIEFKINDTGIYLLNKKKFDSGSQIMIYNIEGKKLISNNISEIYELSMDLQSLSPGVYIAKVKSGNTTETFKFNW